MEMHLFCSLNISPSVTVCHFTFSAFSKCFTSCSVIGGCGYVQRRAGRIPAKVLFNLSCLHDQLIPCDWVFLLPWIKQEAEAQFFCLPGVRAGRAVRRRKNKIWKGSPRVVYISTNCGYVWGGAITRFYILYAMWCNFSQNIFNNLKH